VAGFTVTDDEAGGTAIVSLSVGAATIVFYNSDADAQKDGDEIRKIYAELPPGRGLVRVEGTRLYRIGKPSCSCTVMTAMGSGHF